MHTCQECLAQMHSASGMKRPSERRLMPTRARSPGSSRRPGSPRATRSRESRRRSSSSKSTPVATQLCKGSRPQGLCVRVQWLQQDGASRFSASFHTNVPGWKCSLYLRSCEHSRKLLGGPSRRQSLGPGSSKKGLAGSFHAAQGTETSSRQPGAFH